MASKTVTITEDAYERLKRFRRPDESFSDVINRLTGANADPMAFAGKWTGTGVAEAVERARTEFEAHLEGRQREPSRR